MKDIGMHSLSHLGKIYIKTDPPTIEYVKHSMMNCGMDKLEDLVSCFISKNAHSHMFSSGLLEEKEIMKFKHGKNDVRKNFWEKCWHVTGSYVINRHRRKYDFTVIQRKENGTTRIVPYNLKVE